MVGLSFLTETLAVSDPEMEPHYTHLWALQPAGAGHRHAPPPQGPPSPSELGPEEVQQCFEQDGVEPGGAEPGGPEDGGRDLGREVQGGRHQDCV